MDLKQLFKHWTYQVFAPGVLLREKYDAFKELLHYDDRALELIAELEEIFYAREKVDRSRILQLVRRLSEATAQLIDRLQRMNPSRYLDLQEYFKKIDFYVKMGLDAPAPDVLPPYALSLAAGADMPDAAEKLGGKASALIKCAPLAAESGLKIPPGFVVTTTAYNYFLDAEGLRRELAKKAARIRLSDHEAVSRLCKEMRRLLQEAELPQDVVDAVEEAADKLAVKCGEEATFAVRSSAVAEDGRISFAGQYESKLFVRRENIVSAYKEVLLSKYDVKSVTYRIRQGFSDEETAMAVLVLPMVQVRQAGVVYSIEPGGDGECAAVYSVPGPGEALVAGHVRPETVRLCRGRTPEIIERVPGEFESGKDGADAADIDEATRSRILKLARFARELEELRGVPQDIEWAEDESGDLYLLQARPIPGEHGAARESPVEAVDVSGYEVLLSGGESITVSAAAGPVHQLHAVMDVSEIPPGVVLAAPTLSPNLASLVDRIAGVAARTGSKAGHFASVAREFGLPVIIAGEDVFRRLEQGMEVTLDAAAGTVYKGHIEPLVRAGEKRRRAERLFSETPVGSRLAKVMPSITKLHLTDPEADDFTPRGCKSLHDIIRFAHEKSVSEMFSLVGKGGRGLSGAKKLKTTLPLVLYVLDLGGGLFEGAGEKKEIKPDDIKSLPLWSFWFGLAGDGSPWSEHLLHVDWEEFDRISGGIFNPESRLLASYAVVSADYLHMMIRFGYHFSVIDSVCGKADKNNYIKFRFKGGGGVDEQRLLRLGFIRRVLEHYGFQTITTGDMMDAGLERQDETTVQKRLAVLGALSARTRLMDMSMESEEQAQQLAEEFIQELQA